MKIVFVSDTHEFHRKLNIPRADVLVHAGDFSNHGKASRIVDFNSWLGELIAEGVIDQAVVCAGNHDFLFQNHPDVARALLTNATYLEDSGIEIGGIKFWGSPYSGVFGNWAFMESERNLMPHWDLIPYDTDVLITHGPPHGILDLVPRGENTGSPALLRVVQERLKKLKIHAFGHIHEGYGRMELDGVTFINASNCTVDYWPSNEPIVIEI